MNDTYFPTTLNFPMEWLSTQLTFTICLCNRVILLPEMTFCVLYHDAAAKWHHDLQSDVLLYVVPGVKCSVHLYVCMHHKFAWRECESSTNIDTVAGSRYDPIHWVWRFYTNPFLLWYFFSRRQLAWQRKYNRFCIGNKVNIYKWLSCQFLFSIVHGLLGE